MQLCQPCPNRGTGQVCETNSKAPKSCQVGQIVNGTSCSTCRAGYYCSSPGSLELPCPEGSYSRLGATACTPCPLGSECLTTASLPVKCAAGKYRDNAALKTCLTCPGGKKCADPSVAPVPCLAGKIDFQVFLMLQTK